MASNFILSIVVSHARNKIMNMCIQYLILKKKNKTKYFYLINIIEKKSLIRSFDEKSNFLINNKGVESFKQES